MAPRFVQISTGALICSFVLLPLWAVWGQADGPTSLGPADWSALRFTILQAAFSALLSTLCAVPLARALARAQFWGRAAVIRLMGAPFILPVIVAILGLIAVFGQNGWL
ncbi:thiamine/thiamine pyrophosphate ABC transporter permease ThiP, partial [Rhodobacteraceae bacterium]|nr:thiamine/thiamine pyrophosphate ABC transporter permease ThiP [Paracoccaceae bacterium]